MVVTVLSDTRARIVTEETTFVIEAADIAEALHAICYDEIIVTKDSLIPEGLALKVNRVDIHSDMVSPREVAEIEISDWKAMPKMYLAMKVKDHYAAFISLASFSVRLKYFRTPGERDAYIKMSGVKEIVDINDDEELHELLMNQIVMLNEKDRERAIQYLREIPFIT